MLAHAAAMTARDAAGAVVPTAPSGLTVSQLSETSTRLEWTDNSSNEDEFVIFRGVNGASLSEYTTVSANTTQFDDTGLTTGDTYCYKVAARNEQGDSSKTSEQCVTLQADVPDAPTGFSITAGTESDEMDASWTDNSTNEDGFRVINDADGSTLASVGANVTSTTITGLDPKTEYTMYVEAFNSSGSSESGTDTAKTRLEQPVLSKQVFSEGTAREFIELSWDAIDGADDYEVQKDGSAFDTTTNTSYTVDCPDATGTWNVVARASNFPNSDQSNSQGHTC